MLLQPEAWREGHGERPHDRNRRGAASRSRPADARDIVDALLNGRNPLSGGGPFVHRLNRPLDRRGGERLRVLHRVDGGAELDQARTRAVQRRFLRRNRAR